MADSYLIHDDEGTWWAYAEFPSYGATDDPPLVILTEQGETSGPATESQMRHWWNCGPLQPVALEQAMKPTTRTVEWRLPEGVTLPDFPPVMTPEERQEFSATDDRDCGPLSLYERVTEEVEREPVRVDLSDAKVLRTRGPDDVKVPDGLRWKCNMPSALRERGEYGWLFPGYLEGLGPAFAKIAERHPGVGSAYDGGKVFPKLGSHVTVKVGSRMNGEDLADAVEKWERHVDNLLRQAGAMRKPCQQCAGRGYVEPVTAPTVEPKGMAATHPMTDRALRAWAAACRTVVRHTPRQNNHQRGLGRAEGALALAQSAYEIETGGQNVPGATLVRLWLSGYGIDSDENAIAHRRGEADRVLGLIAGGA